MCYINASFFKYRHIKSHIKLGFQMKVNEEIMFEQIYWATSSGTKVRTIVTKVKVICGIWTLTPTLVVLAEDHELLW